MSNTVTTIRRFVLEEFLPGARPEELHDSADLLATGVMDSLGVLKLIAWVEHEFAVPVADRDLDPDNFRSVQAVASFVEVARQPVG